MTLSCNASSGPQTPAEEEGLHRGLSGGQLCPRAAPSPVPGCVVRSRLLLGRSRDWGRQQLKAQGGGGGHTGPHSLPLTGPAAPEPGGEPWAAEEGSPVSGNPSSSSGSTPPWWSALLSWDNLGSTNELPSQHGRPSSCTLRLGHLPPARATGQGRLAEQHSRSWDLLGLSRALLCPGTPSRWLAFSCSVCACP